MFRSSSLFFYTLLSFSLISILILVRCVYLNLFSRDKKNTHIFYLVFCAIPSTSSWIEKYVKIIQVFLGCQSDWEKISFARVSAQHGEWYHTTRFHTRIFAHDNILITSNESEWNFISVVQLIKLCTVSKFHEMRSVIIIMVQSTLVRNLRYAPT